MKHRGLGLHHMCNSESLSSLRSDLSGGGHHVLAGLGDGSGRGHFSLHTRGFFRGLLPAPGGGVPAGWGDHDLHAWA